jgi:hypothetical protein
MPARGLLGPVECHLGEREEEIGAEFIGRDRAVETGYRLIRIGLKILRQIFAMQHDPGKFTQLTNRNHIATDLPLKPATTASTGNYMRCL